MPLTIHNVFGTVEGWVAIGTVGLALGTFVVALLARSTANATKELAEETRGVVEATKELARVSAQEVEMSRRALQAEIKPLIVDWPADNRRVRFDRSNGDALVVVPACNAAAPALITGVTMHWYDRGVPDPVTYIGWPTVLAPMAGGETEARFSFGLSAAHRLDEIERLGKFWVEFAYTDAAGEQPEVSRLDIYYDDVTERWDVWKVSIRRAADTEPYATAQPVNR